MTYALIVNGQVSAYPYSFERLRADHPEVSFPRDPSDEWLAGYGVMKIASAAPPAPSISKNAVEDTPALANGVWTQTWREVDATAEEIADRTKIASITGEFNAAKLDAWIVSYLAMTPDEARQFVLDNSATLAALRTNVARLAYAVRVLIRRELNV